MAERNKQQCANPACSCPVTSGEYCSTECQSAAESPNGKTSCDCGHADCRGKAQYAKPRWSMRFRSARRWWEERGRC